MYMSNAICLHYLKSYIKFMSKYPLIILNLCPVEKNLTYVEHRTNVGKCQKLEHKVIYIKQYEQ